MGNVNGLKIFLIEDDAALAEGISFALEREGYQMRCFLTCREGRKALAQCKPDLVLLDWNLPDGDGLKLCREISGMDRREGSGCHDGSGLEPCRDISRMDGVPVLMLTARDMEIDQVMCLESGADDYIAKPFSLAVLKARVAALLRRRGGQNSSSYLISGDIRLSEKEMKVYQGDKELDLSLTEFKLLRYFLENKNQVLLKEQILARVWDEGGSFVEENTLTVNIRRLRTKVEEDASNPRYIKTVYGMGYLWEEKHES